MDTLNKNTGDFVDEICCDESNYLVWKWHPAGPQQGTDPRGNAIRWDSPLRVRDGEVAVFVYHQQDGIYQDFIEGPCDQVLKTANLPVLREISGPADDDTPFQAEVYFINLVQAVEVRFGEPFFDVYDPRLDLSVPVTTRGAINFGIRDYRRFVELNRLDEFNFDDFKIQIRDAVRGYVKATIANAPTDLDIPLAKIERSVDKINDAIGPQITERLSSGFGIKVSFVCVDKIELDIASDNYHKLGKRPGTKRKGLFGWRS